MSEEQRVEHQPESTTSDDRDELLARVAELEEERDRLRAEYVRARQHRYRRTALGLAVLGAAGVGGAVVFPDSRSTLFALGGMALFSAVVVYYLTPERFVAASVGEAIYRALSRNEDALQAELGLDEGGVYVPRSNAAGEPARLFFPQYADAELPDPDDLSDLLHIPADARERGVALVPSGEGLFEEFRTGLRGGLAPDAESLADQVADALVEQFELADAVTAEVEPESERVRFAVRGSAYGDLDRLDHPIPSFLAVGLAVGLETPIRVDIAAGDTADEYLVDCQSVETA